LLTVRPASKLNGLIPMISTATDHAVLAMRS